MIQSNISLSLRRAFTATVPVAMGYLPLGIAFGILFSRLGVPWWWSFLMAATVYSGGAQFLAVALLAAGQSPLLIFFTSLALGFRHVFYGIPLADRYRPFGKLKFLAILGLTDETFGVLTAHKLPEDDAKFVAWVSFLNYFYWVAACTLGATIGQYLAMTAQGLDFALVALFTVILVDRVQAEKSRAPLIVAAIMAAIVCLLAPEKSFLFLAILGTAVVLLIGRLRYAES